MSMFHELMMRKKEEIMYVTIKGTLTENDGVFSGFSASNYLEGQQNFDVSSNFEIVIKLKASSVGNGALCIGTGGYSLGLNFARSGGALFRLISYSGSTTRININIGTTSTDFVADQYYFVKIKRKDNMLYLSYSLNGKDYIAEDSQEILNDLIVGKLILGRYVFNGTSLSGSIDLNNSYIKLGSTKYKLQAVVGYTIVGSPTIVDGVLINPTDKQNTIKTAEALDVGNGSFEMQFCLLNPTVKGTPLFRIDENNGSRCTFSATNTFNLYPNYQTDSSVVLRALGNFWNSAINNSAQKVYLRIKCTGKDSNNEYPFIFSGSTDGITWQSETVISSLPLATGKIQYCSSYSSYATGYVVGYDLDLKETWIKKDGKLWFNGQEG